MTRKAMQWAREHRDMWVSIHNNTELVFDKMSLDDLKKLDKYLVHHSPTKGKHQGSKYFIAIFEGYYVYVRVANHWGPFSTNTGEVDPGGDFRHSIPYIYKNYNWELKGVAMKKRGGFAKISQAGYIRLVEVTDEVEVTDVQE